MQVNAINTKLSYAGQFKAANNNMSANQASFTGDENKRVSNHSITNATKALALATLLTAGAATALQSCDKADFEYNHCIEIPIPVDTVYEHHYYPVPGEDRVDTVRIKPGYDSPVGPVIEDFFDNNGIDPGDGRIPVLMRYIDEYRHPKVTAIFNENKSSYNEMWFDVTTNDYDDEAMDYVDGKNENYYRIGYSTPDGRDSLAINLQRLKSKNLDKSLETSWTTMAEAIYNVKTGERFTINELGETEYAGSYSEGDVPGSIFFTNPNGAKWRYANIQVESVTPKDTIIDPKKEEE